jgi:hypothetical protein
MRLSFIQVLVIFIIMILLFGDIRVIKKYLNVSLVKVRIFFNKIFYK